MSRRTYVSAVGSNVITVSGPPSTLQQLFEASSTFRGSRRIQIPVHGPYHAPHLHGDGSLQKILGSQDGSISRIIDRFHPKIPVLSTTSGERFTATSTRQLLEQILNEALNETLRFDRVLDGCVASVKGCGASICRIVPLGPINSIHGVVSVLKKGTEASIILENDSSFMSAKLPYNNRTPGNLAESKLAIVGMAGRFPGAADHEKFWQLLEQGLDVHREVRPPCLRAPICIRKTLSDPLTRFQKSDSIRKHIMTLLARREIQRIRHMVVSLMSLVYSILGFSTCPLGRLCKPTRCRDFL